MAISHLEPWRAEIPIKFFASRIRFQIRIDDLRALVKDGKAKIDNILGKLIFLLKLDANKYFVAIEHCRCMNLAMIVSIYSP